jgi:hypothetical protein
MGIGEDEFFEFLGQKDPSLPEILKAFLAKAEAFGVYADIQNGLNLKHASPTGKPFNMGTIYRGGIVDTWASTFSGTRSAEKTYSENLAKLIGGSVKEMKNGQLFARTKEGRMPRLSDLLPQHEQAWLDAMEQYIRESLAALPAGTEP